MKIEADAKTMTALHEALGAVVRATVATLPPAQQKVFLTRLSDSADSAELAQDDLLILLLNDLVEIGISERRPE